MQLKDVFLDAEPEPDAPRAAPYCDSRIRHGREGLLSLDAELAKIQDPFLKDSLMLAIDGVNATDLRKMMELQLDYEGEKDERIPKVFDAAGGYAPTIGIIGAVMGLIQVMQHLQDINEVGKGIAVAFVATIYGVASANFFFLPWAGKLRIRLRERQVIQEMTLEAVLSIIEGVNPRALEMQLSPVCESACAGRAAKKWPRDEADKTSARGGEAASHERWLLSYSDFITLLFAFFVVLFATSYRDKQSIKKLSHAIHNGFQSWALSRATCRAARESRTGSPEVFHADGPSSELRQSQLRRARRPAAPGSTSTTCSGSWKQRSVPRSGIRR